MPLFTGKGDNGTTTLFGKKDRIKKDSPEFTALGTMDELNSFTGYIRSNTMVMVIRGVPVGMYNTDVVEENDERYSFFIANILFQIQEDLFVAQAQIAGADKKITEIHVKNLEKMITALERGFPAPTSFIIPGGYPVAAMCDVARTIARRTERAVIAGFGDVVDDNFKAYFNRLSTVFYALARFINARAGAKEEAPTYGGQVSGEKAEGKEGKETKSEEGTEGKEAKA